MKKLWLAVAFKRISNSDHVFEIRGLFGTEKKAAAVCNQKNHGYGPLNINEELPEELTEWPGFTYPILEDEE